MGVRDISGGVTLPRYDREKRQLSGHIAISAPYAETNSCAEGWVRTLKEQCLWAELHGTVDEMRHAVTTFVQTYNTQWLIGRLGHCIPKEAYQDVHTIAAT